MLNIEKNIPLPTVSEATEIAKKMYEEMKKGDTAFFENPKGQKIQAALSFIKFKKAIKDRVFISRSEGNGIRFWRL